MKTIISHIITAMLSGSFGAMMMAIFVAGRRTDEKNGVK